MNKSYHPILTSVWLLACLATTTAMAREEVASNLRLITSVPEDDYSPALTPDGKWAVFVSERTGDKQLFTTPLTPGAIAPARQLAPNPGDDYSPQISPDGKWLAWVSTREDAFGDVWVMKYPDGKPIQVSKRGQRDTNPLWHRTENGLLRPMKRRILTACEERLQQRPASGYPVNALRRPMLQA
jgi:dipeptidyl aminopeptidase/acylaminoacyl peptidase